jgi:hypothetical protein
MPRKPPDLAAIPDEALYSEIGRRRSGKRKTIGGGWPKGKPRGPSKRKIMDEFTDLPVSRQRKQQLRKIKAGLCRFGSCKLPIAISELCVHHSARYLKLRHARHMKHPATIRGRYRSKHNPTGAE